MWSVLVGRGFDILHSKPVPEQLALHDFERGIAAAVQCVLALQGLTLLCIIYKGCVYIATFLGSSAVGHMQRTLSE